MTTDRRLMTHYRFFSTLARKKLDRARRLHARLAWPRVRDHAEPTLESVRVAREAKRAGLYAASTAVNDVQFSLCVKWFKQFGPLERRNGGWAAWWTARRIELRPSANQVRRLEERERNAAPAADQHYEDW
jgi:hypothetical protein